MATRPWQVCAQVAFTYTCPAGAGARFSSHMQCLLACCGRNFTSRLPCSPAVLASGYPALFGEADKSCAQPFQHHVRWGCSTAAALAIGARHTPSSHSQNSTLRSNTCLAGIDMVAKNRPVPTLPCKRNAGHAAGRPLDACSVAVAWAYCFAHTLRGE